MGYVVGSRGVGVYPAPPCYGVSGMYIEEAYKHSTWCGLHGIEMVVSAQVTEVGRERPVSVTIRIRGSITPTVAIHIDTLSYTRYRKDEWIAAIHGWVKRQGYRKQWVEELARYNHVLSQVHLPHEGKSVSYEGAKTGTAISYRLSLGWLQEAYIDVYLWVGYYPRRTTISSLIYIELVEEDIGDDGRKEHNHILIGSGVYDDILPITTESLMPIVRDAVEQFTKRVRGLLGEPLVPLQPIEEEVS